MTRHARLVCAALALSTGSARGEVVSRGPIAIRARGDAVLGRDTMLHVYLRDVPGITLSSTVGTLSAPIADRDGLRAELLLPAQRFPQLALVIARASDGSIVDWLGVPLAGQARLRVNTVAAASVVIDVAGTLVGPVVASAAGVAEIQIVVPPGVRNVRTVARAPSGLVTERDIALEVPPVRRIWLACGQDEHAYLVVASESGQPSQEVPEASASPGLLSPLRLQAPGLYVARFEPTAHLVSATVSASVSGWAGTEQCELVLTREPPRAIEVTADRVRVEGEGEVRIRVRLVYAGLRPPASPEISIVPEAGTVSTPAQEDDGSWAATWRLPAARREARVVRARVGAGRASAQLAIEVADPPPSTAHPRAWSLHVASRAGMLANGGRIVAPIAMISASTTLARLRVDLASGVYTSSLDDVAVDGELIDGRMSAVPVLARIAYHRRSGAAEGWVGAGGGLIVAWSRVHTPASATVVETHLRPAAVTHAGAASDVGPGKLSGEIAYMHATVDGMAIAGRIGGFAVMIGYGLDL